MPCIKRNSPIKIGLFEKLNNNVIKLSEHAMKELLIISTVIPFFFKEGQQDPILLWMQSFVLQKWYSIAAILRHTI